MIVDAANPGLDDCAIDLACGRGSVACALAGRASWVVGFDFAPAMLEQALTLAESRSLQNVEWTQGDIYSTEFADAAFDVVTCRFAFHHLEDPTKAFAEMARLMAPRGRIVLSDGVASDEMEKARAFNAVERRRDPSTVSFRTVDYLRSLFVDAGLGEPQARFFQVAYLAEDLVGRSFPEDGDRAQNGAKRPDMLQLGGSQRGQGWLRLSPVSLSEPQCGPFEIDKWRTHGIKPIEYLLELCDTSREHRPVAVLRSSSSFPSVCVGDRFDDEGRPRSCDMGDQGSPKAPRRYRVHSIKHVITEHESGIVARYCLNLMPYDGDRSPVWGKCALIA